MGLIRCPECNKKISDTCDTCVHCGYKLTRNVQGDLNDSEYKLSYYTEPEHAGMAVLRVLGIIFGALLAVAAVALLIYTLIHYKQLEFAKSVIMEVCGVVSLLVGVTAAVLCYKLL